MNLICSVDVAQKAYNADKAVTMNDGQFSPQFCGQKKPQREALKCSALNRKSTIAAPSYVTLLPSYSNLTPLRVMENDENE